VREPVHIEHLHPCPDGLVHDEQGELGFEGVGQAAGEGGQQDRWPGPGTGASARQAPPVTWAGPM
jgi:hypothetical protein